jgi:predicted AlkP superfamily pyrophosphatase or phosphodiesterase
MRATSPAIPSRTIILALLAALAGPASAQPPPAPPAPGSAQAPPAARATARAGGPTPIVVLAVFDGFSPAYLGRAATPTLDRMRAEGAWTHHMVPAFPTVSLVNGFTIATGCWPEGHGIVANRFFDPELGFYDHAVDADWLTGCELLHAAAERQGVRTAALRWYGAYSTRRGPLASVATRLEEGGAYPGDEAAAREAAALLAFPEAARPRLVLAYFAGPDRAAHFTGMDSAETRQAVARADAATGILLAAVESLAARGERASLVVTSDHGMLPVAELVNVERILRWHGIEARVAATGTTAFVYLDDPTGLDAAVAALSGYEAFRVIRRDAQPDWSHLGTGPRVGDLVLSARPPYFIEDRGMWPPWLRWLAFVGPRIVNGERSLKASHGYPPDEPGVHGILYAWGAGVARGREVPAVGAVDVAPTLARLLGIEPGRAVHGEVAAALLE